MPIDKLLMEIALKEMMRREKTKLDREEWERNQSMQRASNLTRQVRSSGEVCCRMDGMCYVCRSEPAAHVHHLAPKHRFSNDADLWPKVFICGGCHTHWHQVMGR